MFFGTVSSSTPDHELLLRTHRGDDRAARELWSRFGPSLIAYAGSMLDGLGGRAAGEDIVQSVFCRVLEASRVELRAVRDARAWLATLVRHAALNARRARRREAHRLSRAGPVLACASRGTDDDLMARFSQLDEDLREAVLLKHAAGLTFDQMSDVLGVARSTLSSRYQKALSELRGAGPVHSAPEPMTGGVTS